jgi:uncharacterized protein with FMN-binding domain
MKAVKPLTALAITAAGSALVIGFQVPSTGASAPVTAATTSVTTTTAQGATGTSGSTSTSGSGSTPTSGSTSSGSSSTSGSSSSSSTATTAKYADGTYLGEAVPEPWGTFQVQATVSGGQLVAVTVVSAPTDGHSSRINSQVVGTLTSAALSSQSASVDVISGATWTSESYATSLQAALDDAAAAVAA